MNAPAGAAIDICDERGRTPLLLACAQSRPDSVALFLSLGANVNRSDCLGTTPLMTACDCQRDSCPIITSLVDYGSHMQDRDKEGFGLSSYIGCRCHMTTVNKLGYNFNGPLNSLDKDGTTYLMSLCQSEDQHGMLDMVLRTGVDVNERDASGSTALDYQVQRRPSPEAERTLRLLQEAGAVHGQKVSPRPWWGISNKGNQFK